MPGGRLGIDIAISSFGYKSSITICRRYGFIRRGKVTDGARFDGRMLHDVVTNDNTASDVWADTAYLSRSNEAWLKSIGRVSRVHRKKPRGKPMSARTARANAARSTARARVEHVFAHQKDQMGGSAQGSDEAKHRWKRLRRAIRPHHRHRARRGEDHARQPRLQYRPPDVPRTQGSHGIATSGEGALREKTSRYAAFKPETQRKTLSSRRNPRQRHVDVGAQLSSLAIVVCYAMRLAPRELRVGDVVAGMAGGGRLNIGHALFSPASSPCWRSA